MLTIERARGFDTAALDWTSNDIREAIANARHLEEAGLRIDHRRVSEYHDELAVVAQVRAERNALATAHLKACPHCGRKGA